MLDIQLFREEVKRIREDHDRRGLPHDNIDKVIAVSYTHLTLPTNREV